MAYETTPQLMAEVSEYWRKRPGSNFYNLVDIFNKPLERISDQGYKVMRWRGINDAKGKTLDLIGHDIETYRPSDDDELYKFMIRLMKLASRAQGTIPSIIKITSYAIEHNGGFKIWKTGPPRHIGIQIPWDYVQRWPIEKFLLENLQHMLALGYWLDEIVFFTRTELPLYVGVGNQDKTTDKQESGVIWWTGWKARATRDLYRASVASYQVVDNSKAGVTWWTGWSAKSTLTPYIGVVGRIISTEVTKAETEWWEGRKQTLHAGLTIGSKTITTTTQSLTTE